MARWTTLMIKHRWPVLIVWLLVLLVTGYAGFVRLPSHLSDQFTIPGSDSERVRTILADSFGSRSDGSYLIVAQVKNSGDAAIRKRVQTRIAGAASEVPTAHGEPLQVAGKHVLFATISSELGVEQGKAKAKVIRRALRDTPGVTFYVSGDPAIAADLQPVFQHDVARGEGIAIPIALIVLLLVFGVSLAVSVPFLMAACSIATTLGFVFLFAHLITMPQTVTNLVQLVGLGIAIDYSLLIVYRFREELTRDGDMNSAIVRTMETAGRAVVFSGATVAIGLALLLLMPLPFMRAVGIGGFLIPLVSITAALTLQPVLLSLLGPRGTRRAPIAEAFRRGLPLRPELLAGTLCSLAGVALVLAGATSLWPLLLGLPVGLALTLVLWSFHVHTPVKVRLPALPLPRFKGSLDASTGFWARLAEAIMRRPIVFLALGGVILVAAFLPARSLALTPGTMDGFPQFPESIRGFNVLAEAVGPGALSPTVIMIDSGRPGGLRNPKIAPTIKRLVRGLQKDPEVARVTFVPAAPFVDASGRYARLVVVGKHTYGESEARAFVPRLRGTIIPNADAPDGVRVLAGGGPAVGYDFIKSLYEYFPYLVAMVLVFTYLVLMRAFRSWLLPLKAVLLNLLSVGAAYGLLVIFFRYGLGHALIDRVYQQDQIEAWIPVILFAMLFGLSMDYEVFLVSRMREVWDGGADNARAISEGLERTGRIVTAAAVIMVAAFSGFVAGRVAAMQQFGFGLAAAILLDATIIRALLVPSLMTLMGRYNWWLPAPLARIVRAAPSPLTAHSTASEPE
jgi:RND superfamily putative drug exporter